MKTYINLILSIATSFLVGCKTPSIEIAQAPCKYGDIDIFSIEKNKTHKVILFIPDDDSAIDAGNPNLKATYAYNFDLMLEKYYKSVGLLSGGVFYKKLNDFIYTYRDNQYTNAKFSQDFPNLVNPIPAVNPGNWSLTQQRNGENVSVYGFEVAIQRQLDFIPGKFFKGLGIYLNYTFTDSEAKGITNAVQKIRSTVNNKIKKQLFLLIKHSHGIFVIIFYH